MARILQIAAILVAGGTLAACVTSENPADGGFFNGVSGLGQGTYQARIDTRNRELSSLQSANERLLAVQERQNAEAAALSHDLASLQARYNTVSGDIDTLSARLANLNASGASVGSQMTRLQAIRSQRSALAAGGVSVSEAERIQQLEIATLRLRQAVDDAFGVGVGL